MVCGLVLLLLAFKACTAEFQPVTVYEQIRKSDSSGVYPKPNYVEDPNAHRLRESIAVTKVQQVYEEKGYEEGEYDHGHSYEHGRSYEDYTRFPAPRSDAQEDYSDSPWRANKPTTRIRNYDSEPSHEKETTHRKRYTDDYADEDHEEEFEGDDEETAVEHITVSPTWKEETAKKALTKTNFDKLANREIDEFKKNFEKEWKEIKIGPELKEGLEKLKKEVREGKPKENKKPKKESKTARNMKKKDKYNMFKYKPIRVPHTSIQGLGPFRPLVIGSKVIYPGQIAKTPKQNSIIGMHSTISMTTYPYKWVPAPTQSQIYKVQTKGSLTSPHVKRSPPLVKYPDFSSLPPNVYNSPQTSNSNTRTSFKSHSSLIKSSSGINGFNFQSGFTPIFPGNNDSSQKLKVSSNNLSFSPQTVSNSNARPGKSRGMKKATRENVILPFLESKETEEKPQNLNRGQVKYIEKLTSSHFAAPVKKQTFKPVPKIKQEQIKDLAMKLNSEHTMEDLTKSSSFYNKRFGRTGQSNKNFDSNENKYPFYKKGQAAGISEDSPLHYIRNPNLRPIKTKRNMVLYIKGESNPCDDPNIPINVLPKYKKDSKWVGDRNVDGPRAKNLGSDIKCLKNKYFGEEPLDNPLFQEIKREPVDTIKQTDNINSQRFRPKGVRTKRDVDLSKYHVVLTRQSRRPTYDYEDDEERHEDAKTEETSHAETSTIAATPVTKDTSKIEETTITNEVTSAVPIIKHKFRSTTEKPKENYESGEESLEKLITVMTRPMKRVHRPRHAYSSRYSSTKRPYTTAKPKSTPEPQTTTVRTTPQTQARPEPEPTEEGKMENKRMVLKQRIKFMIARPVKFSLVPSSSQESTEQIRTTTTTTEEPSTTSEPTSSVTTRMYPPKRKILKLRKGPFNIFSVLNNDKSSTTKFPLMDYYNEAKMSSSETVETYEEPNMSSPEFTPVGHAVTEHPRRIKMRRLASTYLRDKKSNSQGEENLTNKSLISETHLGGNDKKKFVSNKKERAVEVEFHQVLVQKVDPIEELMEVTPPMMINYAQSSSISPLVQTSSQTEVKTRPSDDSNLYSGNATPTAGSWKKYKQEKIVRGKLRKRTEVVRETTPATPPEGNESRIYERLEEHQEHEEDLYKRRRRPTTSKPYFLPTSVYENDNKQTEISKSQAFVVGLMSQVIPKEVNSLGLPTAQVPESLLASGEIGDDGSSIEVTGFGQEKHEVGTTIAAYSDGDIISRSPIVVSSTTAEPQWKQEPMRFNDGHRRRRPIAEPTVAVSEVQHRRKPIRLTITSTEVPEVKITPMKKQTRWRKPSSTTPEPELKQDEPLETSRWKGADSIEEPSWNPGVNAGETVENIDDWTATVTTQEPPKWKPVTIPEPFPWKSGQSTEKPKWKTHRVINFEPTTENGKSLSSYYEEAEEEINDSPAPVYETDEELALNFDLHEPSSLVESEQSQTRSSYNEEHKLPKGTDQPQWTNPPYNEDPKLPVQTEEPQRVPPSYDVEPTYQTEQPKRTIPSYNDETIHQVQNEQHKRRRPSYNEESTYQVQTEQHSRRRPSYSDESELPRETQQPHKRRPTHTDESELHDRETEEPQKPFYNGDHIHLAQTGQSNRRKPSYNEEPKLPENEQSSWSISSYNEETKPIVEEEQPKWINPSYNEEPVKTEPPQRRPAYEHPNEHPRRRRPSYKEDSKVSEENQQSQWRRPSYNIEPTIQIQTEPPQRRPVNDDEFPKTEERPAILIPTLIPVYPKQEEEPQFIGYNKNYEVNSNPSVETIAEQVEETTEQPKKRKPMHIIRKPKPKTEKDELDDIISPAFNVETMEKRRKVHLKKSKDGTEAKSSGSSQDSQLDESEIMRRRKMFLQNLLRPSIQRHKTTEQSDIHTAESSTGWIKDPRQRSYFYVND